jgi:CDP-diacylglycerol--serine O-phosphatidyltransferase
MPGPRRLRRGIYILPTLFTVGNLFCGFSAVLQASHQQFEEAARLIFLAGLLDLLDGRIARLTGSTSEFGVEFDSLADLASFGVAPAFLIWEWALSPLHRLGWLLAFLFVVCAAMRLARFNIQAATSTRKYFVGLPAPAAAGAVACLALVFPEPRLTTGPQVGAACLTTSIALLMVSRVRYRSFKDFNLRHRRSYLWALPVAAVLGVTWSTPAAALGLLAAAYVASGPIGWVVSAVRRMTGKPPAPGDDRSRAPGMIDEPLAR